MSGLCRILLISLLFFVLTTLVNGQNDLYVVFRTVNDEYVAFEGEDIGLECSHPVEMQNVVTSLYLDSGEVIISSIVSMQNITPRIVTGTLRDISNSPTVYCNVSGGAQASAKLTVKTIPRAMSPYCESNYTDGILINTAIKLSCFVDTRVPVNEQWRNSSDVPLPAEERLNVFPTTRRTVSTALPTATNNGTYYTCVNFLQGGISGSCQLGPIFVYENYETYNRSRFSSTEQSSMVPTTVPTSAETTLQTQPKVTTDENLTLFVILAAAGGVLVTASVLLGLYCCYKLNKKCRKTRRPVASSSGHGDKNYAHYLPTIRSTANKESEKSEYYDVGSSYESSNEVNVYFGNAYDSPVPSVYIDTSKSYANVDGNDFKELHLNAQVEKDQQVQQHGNTYDDVGRPPSHAAVYRNVIPL